MKARSVVSHRKNILNMASANVEQAMLAESQPEYKHNQRQYEKQQNKHLNSWHYRRTTNNNTQTGVSRMLRYLF